MLNYPARLEPREDGAVRLTLPDVPEVAIDAASEEEAMRSAPAMLETILASYVLDGRPIPRPSDICGAPMVGTDRYSLLGVEVPQVDRP